MIEDVGDAEGEMVVPEDFPREHPIGAVSGAQPKLLLVEIDGKYSNRVSDEERAGRYLMCSDLLDQMVQYAQRKVAQNPEISMGPLTDAIITSARKKGWEIHEVEFDWIFKHLRAKLSDSPPSNH